MAIDDAAGRAAIRMWIAEQHEELGRKSYYQLLGVAATATEAEIRTAYYQLVARFHPDLYGGAEGASDMLDVETRARLVSLYSRLVEAYRVLRDSGKRTQYARLVEQGKLRFTVEEERAPRRDPDAEVGNPAARRFFKLGRAALGTGDMRGAMMNFKLALSVEPGNALIQSELTKAEALVKGK